MLVCDNPVVQHRRKTVTTWEHAPVPLTYPAARLHHSERGLSRKWCG